MIEFEPFPKLARLARECVVTEKLDGTNAQVIIRKLEDNNLADLLIGYVVEYEGELYEVAAASRTRLITPGKTTDNYGFAAWVFANAGSLVQLGEGRHFGEWYGRGIQRGYGIMERRFALFDTSRYVAGPAPATQEFDGRVRTPDCVSVVPELHRGDFDTAKINAALTTLGSLGSRAVPGFMNPEGIVIWHTHARVSFKKTFDDKHKEAA